MKIETAKPGGGGRFHAHNKDRRRGYIVYQDYVASLTPSPPDRLTTMYRHDK